MNPQPYSSSFLRYHHAPDSGEFVNVGVVLWAPETRFMGFRASRKYGRLSRFFGEFDHEGYRQLITRIEGRFEKLSEEIHQSKLVSDEAHQSAREIAFQVIPEDDAALQWSTSFGGETRDPEAELLDLYQEYIQHYNQSAERERRDEAHVFREVYRKAFQDPKVARYITEHEVVAPLDKHLFQQAWKNGHWNVYETLSFDLAEVETIRSKALKWDSRSRHLSASEEPPNIHYLLGRPESEKHRRAYGNAKDILHSSGKVVLIEEDEAEDFSKDLIVRACPIVLDS